MKEAKSICIILGLGALVFVVGFLGGIHYDSRRNMKQEIVLGMEDSGIKDSGIKETDPADQGIEVLEETSQVRNVTEISEEKEKSEEVQDERIPFAGFLDVASLSGVLGTDTEYVVEEMDVLRGTVVETSLKLPAKYVGMDLDSFVQAMNAYAATPPLSELERGFVGLEVLSFSRQRVVVQMNYRYVQPGESFYLALMDHQVVVLLEDQKTVYISTGISANMLSESMREQLATGLIFVEDESSLYDFLESYSS